MHHSFDEANTSFWIEKVFTFMYIASPKLNLFASESALQIQLFDTMAGITIFCPKYNMLFSS